MRRFVPVALYIDVLVQERRNSIANALELHFSCTNPSICVRAFRHQWSRKRLRAWSARSHFPHHFTQLNYGEVSLQNS